MKITSKDLFAQVKKQHETTLAAAFKSGNPEQMAEAMTAFFDVDHCPIYCKQGRCT